MNISFRWLTQYIDLQESPEQIAQILTQTGLEVENITPLYTSFPPHLSNLLIGEVITCQSHPNADKLFVTTVDVGEKNTLRIVCGAPNIARGQKVIVAKPGVTMYSSNTPPQPVRATRIRGEMSEAVICSEAEAGLGEDTTGIMELHTHLPNGSVATALYTPDDWIFDIGLTPNRSDATSHIGVARDLKAALNGPISLPNVHTFKEGDSHSPIEAIDINSTTCVRYSAVNISGLTVKESPPWLKNYLTSIGLIPVNNVVDVTNFVLHETGQPLHAFDTQQIAGKKIQVKTLPKGTIFHALNRREITLTDRDVMICDEIKPLCIAGVIGGFESGVSTSTQSVFLESACFFSDKIRHTVTHHQIKTDASFRFERGTDPNQTVYALKRATLLINELAGGKNSSLMDVYPDPVDPCSVQMEQEYIDRLIGEKIPQPQIIKILEDLDFQVTQCTPKGFTASVPTYRTDVTQPADVIEEILRIYGLNRIGINEHARADYIEIFPQKHIDLYKRDIGNMLAYNGFLEIVTNSLTDIKHPPQAIYPFDETSISILNRLSPEQGVLRKTLLFSGLNVCAYNINRKQSNIQFFEFGKIYGHTSQGDYVENESLSIFMSGKARPENWKTSGKDVDLFDIMQYAYQVIERSTLLEIRREICSHVFFEFGTALLLENTNLGYVGKIKKEILQPFGIKQDVYYVELSIKPLFESSSQSIAASQIPRYPEVRRDLSLILDKKISYSDIIETIKGAKKTLVKDVILFDVYEGSSIPKDKKAYALGIILYDDNKTLTDEEIDRVMSDLITLLEKKMQAQIRKESEK